MAQNRLRIAAAREKWQKHEADCGSSTVQVAMLTERIRYMTEHLKVHRKDLHSLRGLKQMLADRRTHLLYLERKDPIGYKMLLEQLNIRIGTGDERVSRTPPPPLDKTAAKKKKKK